MNCNSIAEDAARQLCAPLIEEITFGSPVPYEIRR